MLFAARAVINGSVLVKRTSLDVPLLALVGSALLSAAVGVNQSVAIFGTYARYEGVLTLVTYAALFWLTVQAIANGSDARVLIRALVAGGFAVSLLRRQRPFRLQAPGRHQVRRPRRRRRRT
jgi:hypothetical protein